MSELAAFCTQHRFNTDKNAGHFYLPHYEKHLPDRDRRIDLLEVGVFGGQSLKLWAAWFRHDETRITGIDILEEQAYDDAPRVKTIVGDIKTVDLGDAAYDVIIDDGSHTDTDILAAWWELWPRLRPGGLYVIEDLAVQEWKSVILAKLAEVAYQTMHLRGDVTDLHLYGEILFLRKR